MANKFVDPAGLKNFKSKIETLFAKQSDIPTNTSQLVNDSGYQNSTQVTTIVNNIISQSSEVKQVTLGTMWRGDSTNGYTQSVSVDGITDNDTPLITLDLSDVIYLETKQAQKQEWGKIVDAQTRNGYIVFWCSEVTTVELKLIVKGV